MLAQNKVQSVTELVSEIKSTLESEYHNVGVVGEVSNFSLSSAGHYYFNLIDNNASVSCAFFRMDALRNIYLKRVKDGDKVILTGPISLYLKRGNFQIIGKRITPYGKGDLKAQFELLKSKLTKEGLFDLDHKQTIPSFPKRIAVITAKEGAALQDFLNVMKRRTIWHDILVIPSMVQGEQAPKYLMQALASAQKIAGIELIVLTRGGGSVEDLWAFNNENLVRKMFECPIPIISAVGHQVDYTLSDYVADLRCETPTAAAEIISQVQTQLKMRLKNTELSFKAEFASFKQRLLSRLEEVNPEKLLPRLLQVFNQYKMRLTKLSIDRLENFLQLPEYFQRIDDAIKRSEEIIIDRKTKGTLLLNHKYEMLSSLNPNAVLLRGYSYIKTKEGNVVQNMDSFDKIEQEDIINIHFHDGVGSVKKI